MENGKWKMDSSSDEVGELGNKFLGKLDGALGFALGNGSRHAVNGPVAFLSYPVEPVQFWLERWIEACPEKADHGLVPVSTSGPVPFGIHERRTSRFNFGFRISDLGFVRTGTV